jgi:flagellar M-ring protein FliF
MNGSWTDQLNKTKELFSSYWGVRSTKQKGLIIGTFLFLVVALSLFIYFASRPQYVPLYTGQLTQREVGDIKAELDSQGYTDYQLSDSGTMLLVPKKDASNLLVTLASAGYPKDNKIDYSLFSENLSFGGTDRQYDIIEREAMQNQLAGVLQRVDGIETADVILSLPEESVFVRQEETQPATASVVVDVEPGVKLSTEQIRALYTLVSRSVANLPEENITIMNQYSETLSFQGTGGDELELDKYDEQRKVQKNIEQDIQQSLQSLLSAVLGSDQVYVHTFVKLNFDKVKTQENLVEPSDENNNGIVISSEKNSKTYSGTGTSQGGVVGTGETDIPGYVGGDTGGESEYEEVQNRVNYEVNRINNEIVKSPYQIEDITINVGVEASPDEPNGLAPGVQENIQNIVSNTVRTALGHPELTQDEINQRVTVFPHSNPNVAEGEPALTNNWLLIGSIAAAALLLIGGLIWFIARRKKAKAGEEEEAVLSTQVEEPDYFAEEEMNVESQLKKLLDQRPDDFSKVIKSWLHDEEA